MGVCVADLEDSDVKNFLVFMLLGVHPARVDNYLFGDRIERDSAWRPDN